MSFQEAIAQQPAWVFWWLNWMAVGVFVLPLSLLIWRQSRIVGVVTLLAVFLAAVIINLMYDAMGYVKLLGLAHIIFWTPLIFYLFRNVRREDMPIWPRRILIVILATILISLAFDYVDVLRWLLGERAPTVLPPTG